jgi:hypothetical protein
VCVCQEKKETEIKKVSDDFYSLAKLARYEAIDNIRILLIYFMKSISPIHNMSISTSERREREVPNNFMFKKQNKKIIESSLVLSRMRVPKGIPRLFFYY